MKFNNTILYTTTVLIWGSTWLVITYQLGRVDPLFSIFYRFSLASLILFIYCKLFKLPLKYSLKNHVFMFIQGFFLFSTCYWLVYLAESKLTSGLVAVVFSGIIFFNVFNGALFLKSPIRLQVIIGGILGMFGVALIFINELSDFSFSDASFQGLILSITGVIFASWGDITSARNQKSGLPVIQTNVFGMGYGALIMLVIAVITGKKIDFDFSFSYIVSLFYLALFGSAIAFGCFLTLIGRIGADKAAYTSMLFPVVALILSTLFEGYRWSVPALGGSFLIILGNFLVLYKGKSLQA